MIKFEYYQYKAYCKHIDKKNGFKHDCYISDGVDGVRVSIPYINRTWEKYTFESALLKAAGELETKCLDREKAAFLAKTGAKRITSDRQKKVLDKQLDNSGEYQSIQALKAAIKDNLLHREYIPDM